METTTGEQKLVEEQTSMADENGEEEEHEDEDEDEEEEDEEEGEGEQNPSQSTKWEALTREWLGTFLAESRPVTMSEVESWVSSNKSILPDDLLSLSQSELLGRFSAIQSSLLHEHQETKQSNRGENENPARFQRTNQWLPVYSWLESLDTDEVIKSKEIADWLAENPKISEQLSAKHSRYHLKHYIKKCHIKILKKRGKFKGEQNSSLETSPQVQAVEYSSLSNKESDLHVAKRNEALRKYEILVELEKQLATIVPKQ